MTYAIYYKKDGEFVELEGAMLPFSLGYTLDESLDTGKIDVFSNEKLDIEPFTLIKISVGNGTKTKDLYFFSGTQTEVRKRMATPSRYVYSIELVELTKILERKYLDTITFTKPLNTTSSPVQYAIAQLQNTDNYGKPFVELNDGWALPTTESFAADLNIATITSLWYPPTKIKYTADGTSLSPMQNLVSVELDQTIGSGGYGYVVTNKYGPEVRGESEKDLPRYPSIQKVGTTEWLDNQTKLVGEVGSQYKVRYVGFLTNRVLNYTGPRPTSMTIFYRPFTMETTIEVVAETETIEDWTISSVVQRVCNIAQHRFLDDNNNFIEDNAFEIDPNFLSKYVDVNAPDFAFTNETLFEALLDIGKFIHSIPRLTYDGTKYVLTYDLLGDEEKIVPIANLIGEENTFASEDYAEDFIIPSQSLISTLGDAGVLDYWHISLRTEESSTVIKADTGIIMTKYPIYRLKSLNCRIYQNGAYVDLGDIANYVNESAVYNLLSPFLIAEGGTMGKARSLVYTQGQKHIRGLMFQANTLIQEQAAFQPPAILNIAKAIKPTLNISDINTFDFTKFEFTVSYVPIINGRISQHKVRRKIDKFKNEIVYNQTSNVAEAKYLSRNIYAATKRIGNEIIQKTYLFDELIDVRDLLGKRVGDLIISNVNVSYERDHIKATLTFTKNFNRLNAYTSLDSQKRYYEIDEKQSVDRDILIEDNILVSAEPIVSTSNVPLALLAPISNVASRSYDYLQIDTYNKNELLASFSLPVFGLGIGNSLWFHCDCEDNYGVGYQAKPDWKVGAVEKAAAQRLYPYTDALGRFDRMDVMFSDDDSCTSDSCPERPDGAIDPWYDQTVRHIYVNKDSRERIGVSYQYNFVSDNEKIVILPSWTENHPVLGNEPNITGTTLVAEAYDQELSIYNGDAPIGANLRGIDIVHQVVGNIEILNPTMDGIKSRLITRTKIDYGTNAELIDKPKSYWEDKTYLDISTNEIDDYDWIVGLDMQNMMFVLCDRNEKPILDDNSKYIFVRFKKEGTIIQQIKFYRYVGAKLVQDNNEKTRYIAINDKDITNVYFNMEN